MLRLPSAVRAYLCSEPTDMRRSFDTLARMAEAVVGQDPFSGHLFLFRSRRGDRVKVLYWDGDGFALWYKRLEQGVFAVPASAPDGRLDARDLAMMLEGVDLGRVRRRPRYARRDSSNS